MKRISPERINRHAGFTLVEAIIVLAIAAIVVTIGIPSFNTLIKNNQKTTAINDLRTALALARSTAITRRVRVTVCKSANNSDCTTNGDWSQGWIIYVDPNNPGTRDNDEEILRVHDSLSGNATFSGNNLVEDRISFTPQGMTNGTLGTLTYTDSRGADHAAALVISFGGQVRYEDAHGTY